VPLSLNAFSKKKSHQFVNAVSGIREYQYIEKAISRGRAARNWQAAVNVQKGCAVDVYFLKLPKWISSKTVFDE
jgi:hypothetical protein